MLRSSHLQWALLIFVCLIASAMTLFLSPVLIMGLIVVLVSVLLILKYPYVGLLLYMATFLIRPAELYPALEPLHMERMIGILALLASLIRHKREHGQLFFPNDLGTKMLVLFWLLLCASWVVSYDRADTVAHIENFLKLLIFYTIIVYEVNSKAKFDVFLSAFVLLIAFIAFLSFRDYYGGGAIYRMGIQRAIGRTSAGGDPNTMAGTLATAVPLVVACFRVYKNLFVRLACLGILGLLLLMIVNTGSRSGLLTLLAVVGAMVYFSRYRLVSAAVVLMLLVAGWFVVPDQYRVRYGTLLDEERDADEISSGRVAIWENGLRMFLAYPVYGVGGGAFRSANASGDFGPPTDMQAHSLYIQLLATFGIIGAVIWFFFLFSVIRQLLKARPPSSETGQDPGGETAERNRWFDLIRQGMFATVTGLLVSGVFAHSLYRYTWYLIAAMTVAIVQVFYLQLVGGDSVVMEPARTASSKK